MEISGFGVVLLFVVGGFSFIVVTLLVSKLLRPSRPGEQKLSTYESGEEPIGSAWKKFDIKFYVIAIIFLLFEVELVFLFPWATVFADKELIKVTDGVWGWFTLAESFIFIGILVVGLIYVWANGFLDWIKPKPETTEFKSSVPKTYYERINQKYS